MRTIILIVIVLSMKGLKAQTFFPGNFLTADYRQPSGRTILFSDSSSRKNWTVTPYGSFSTSFSFFNGGSASIISAPVGLQLNRKLNNNLYAFAGVSLAPSYINFNPYFRVNDFNKAGQASNFSKPGSLLFYSRAAVGLQYVNDEKTFSISGSIGVERSNYPVLPIGQLNTARPNQLFPANQY